MQPNYIKIINWFWSEVPHIDGYRPLYGLLFLAIVDGINKNDWHSNTPMDYERIANKCRFTKEVYLAGRMWLMNNGFIEFTPGKNNMQIACFSLGHAVGFPTGTPTGTPTGGDSDHRSEILPVSLPIINKPKTINPKLKTPALPVDNIVIPFTGVFKKSWTDWKEYKKKEFRFNYKSIESEKAALNDLLKKSGNKEGESIEIIQQSIANGWKGFYELKNNTNGNTGNNQQKGYSVKGSGLSGLGNQFFKELSEYQEY